jgi:hypothetical protein
VGGDQLKGLVNTDQMTLKVEGSMIWRVTLSAFLRLLKGELYRLLHVTVLWVIGLVDVTSTRRGFVK